jgi:hypothetical protein
VDRAIDFLQPNTAPDIEHLVQQMIQYNTPRPVGEWITVIVQPYIVEDGAMRLVAVALPTPLAHAIKALIDVHLAEIHALTEELITGGM